MSLEEQVGAHLAVGIPGTQATPAVVAHLKSIYARSLVVFARNFVSTDQFRTLLRDLEQALGRPLLVMVDHEGGRVRRFSAGVTRFASADSMAAQGVQAVEEQGRIEAQELRALGVHVNLAPCVDVRVDGSDPIIGDRSYGTEPDRVSALGRARILGLQGAGVAACAKHFPGLGAVPRDPHKTLPTVNFGWEEMEEIHLAPFEEAIAAGVEMIMSSHVCYPGLGEPEGLPATFSLRLIRGHLRQGLGFQGLILTDDMDMGALRECAPSGEGAIRAVEAGHDLLLFCADQQAQREAFDALTNAYQKGRLGSETLESTVRRVGALQKKYTGRP